MNQLRGTTDLLSPKPIQMHPLCKMDGFGQNRLGDNMYRVVYAPSRLKMVGGAWPDGRAEYRFLPLYQAKAWILERWLTPMEFCGMGPDRWNLEFRDPQTGLLLQGPYPDRGEYEMCWDFAGSEPTQGFVSRIIGMIKAGRLKSYSEHLVANRDHAEYEEKQRDNRVDSIVRDALPSFRGQVFVGAHGARSFKGQKISQKANDLSFGGKQVPLKPNSFVTA